MSDGYERRIGGRVDTAALPVRWHLPADGQPSRSWFRREEPEEGLLVNLSVSGLQIRALRRDELTRGATVHFALDGVVGWGTIRRVTPVPGSRFCDYGIELSDKATDLVELVHDRVARRSVATEADWR